MTENPRIHVTNDDGYTSEGIQVLADALEGLGEIWVVAPNSEQSAVSHALTLDLKKTRQISGLRYLPRQDMTNGRIAQYTIEVSADGTTWGKAVAAGTFPRGAGAQTIRFAETQSARFLRLTVTREVDGKPYASVAEIDLILVE